MQTTRTQPLGRHRITRRLLYGTACALAVSGAIALWTIAAAPRSMELIYSRQTTYLLEPRYPDGTIDYVTAINEKIGRGVTHETNGAIPMITAFGPEFVSGNRRVLEALGLGELREDGRYVVGEFRYSSRLDKQRGPEAKELFDLQCDVASERPWTPDEFPLVYAWLQENEFAIPLLQMASERPAFFIPRIPPNHAEGLTSVYLSMNSLSLYHSARLLVRQGFLELGCGDFRGAWRRALGVVRLGRFVGTQGTWLGFILGIAHENHGLRLKLAAANALPREPRRLHQLLADLDALPQTDSAWALEVDRYTNLDSIQNFLRTGDVHSAFNVDASDPADSVFAQLTIDDIDANRCLARVNRAYDDVASMLEGSDLSAQWLRAVEFERSSETWAWLRQASSELKRVFLSPPAQCLDDYLDFCSSPSAQNLIKCALDSETQLRIVRTAILLTLHRVETGEYPESLSDLVPDHMKAVPKERTGGDLVYRRVGAGYILYSFGWNGRDDGGHPRLDHAVRASR